MHRYEDDENVLTTTGQKRTMKLIEEATGKYVVFVDADDKVPDDYVAKLKAACEQVRRLR